MLSIMAAAALYAGLNIWTGMDTFAVIIFGGLAVKPSLWLMRRFSHRAASIKEGATARVSTSFGLIRIACLVFLVALTALAFSFRGGFFPSPEWRTASPVDTLLVAAWLAAVVLLVRVDVECRPAAARAVGGSRKPDRQNSVAVVVVHGIGNQKPGGPLEEVAGSVEQILCRQASQRVMVTRRPSDGETFAHVEFQYAGRVDKQRVKQRVVFLEAFWADAGRRPRGLQTLVWIVKSIPLMLLMAVAPDRRDVQGPSFMRFFCRLAFPLLVLLSLFQPSIRLFTLILLGILAASTAFPPWNLLGDVQIAAARDKELSKIIGVINSAIDAAFVMASRVVVVGHSQGGFLSLRALELRAREAGVKERIKFIGIGSGLKPISLLKDFGDRRSISAAAALALGVLLLMISVVPFLLAILQSQEGFISWCLRVNKQLIDHGIDSGRPPGGRFPALWSHPSALLPDWGQVLALLSGIGLCLFAGASVRPRVRNVGRALRCPHSVSRWIEITSSADTVGRLAWPPLADPHVWNSPSLGQPLLDHVRYFRRSSPVAWYLASTLFPSLLGGVVPALRQWANYLDMRIWRARALSGALGLVILVVYAFGRLDPDARGMRALLDQTRDPGVTFVGLLAVTLVAPVLGMVDRYRLSTALDLRPMAAPPELRRSPMWLRALGASVLFSFAAAVATSGHDSARYPHMSSTEVRLLSVAPTVTAGLICLLAALLAVGYSFSLLAWGVVSLVIYWSSYLPGHGPEFPIFVGLCAFLAALSFTVVGRFVARPVEVSDAAWPSYQPGRTAPLRSRATRPKRESR
ncbi:hypothetical protein [Streptomyces sp. NPDC093094]|uniref:hypothetical protein n=1 Tax=Streptomyces sp. NPDC093094 TaxID=3366026 RepID=UPI00380FDE05